MINWLVLGAIRYQASDSVFYDNKALLDEARKDAIANTRKKAQLYAQAVGVDVGDVVSINELGTR